MDFIADEAIARAREYMSVHMKKSRIEHTERVVETAGRLCAKYGGDPERIRIAAWFHDLVKNLDVDTLNAYVREYGLDEKLIDRPNLSHAKVAAELMKREFGIDDAEICDAVAYHTTGRAGMSLTEKIIFISDIIEPGRRRADIDEIREAEEKDLDRACLMALEKTIDYVNSRGDHLDQDTVRARDDLANIINNKGDR